MHVAFVAVATQVNNASAGVQQRGLQQPIDDDALACSGLCMDGSIPIFVDNIIPFDLDGNGIFDDTCLDAYNSVQLNESIDACGIIQLFQDLCGCPNSSSNVCSPCYGDQLTTTPTLDRTISLYMDDFESCADLIMASLIESAFVTKRGAAFDESICRPAHFFAAALCGCPYAPPPSSDDGGVDSYCQLCPAGQTLGEVTKPVEFINNEPSSLLCGVAAGQLAEVTVGAQCEAARNKYKDQMDKIVVSCCVKSE